MSSAGKFQQAWRALPLGCLDQIIGSGTCLVLAPHPDDESLGCGGMIAACVAAKRPPLVVVLTDGAGSHPDSRAYPPPRLRALREQEVRTALRHLDLPPERVALLGQPDTAAPTEGPAFEAVVSRLVELIHQQEACTAILAPWQYDPHCDHRAASLAARAAALRTGRQHVAYPVWGWTLPPDAAIPEPPGVGWRLDIAEFLPAKRRAIQAHQSQYGNLITDDPTGFTLPPDLLRVFDSPFETFIQP